MANQIRIVKKQLTALIWTLVGMAAVVVVVFETNLLLPGGLAGNVKVEYFSAVLLELLTMAVIPLSLWLFKAKPVKRQMKEMPHKALLKWGTVRLMLLCLPLLLAVIAYYLFQNTAFGYLAIILAICLFFVYPTMQRCMKEANDGNE